LHYLLIFFIIIINNKAFQQLDRFYNGKVTIDDLKTIYSCKKNPKYLNGEWTQDQCLNYFLEQFDATQHKV
jgi:calcyphosin